MRIRNRKSIRRYSLAFFKKMNTRRFPDRAVRRYTLRGYDWQKVYRFLKNKIPDTTPYSHENRMARQRHVKMLFKSTRFTYKLLYHARKNKV